MKHQLLLVAFVTTLILLAPLGCSQKDETDGGSASTAPALDLSKVENAFASATGVIKTEWDKVVTTIKSADYAGAVESLKTLAGNARLSEEQKSALAQLMEQVKARAADLMKNAADAAGKVAEQAKEAADKAKDAASKAAD